MFESDETAGALTSRLHWHYKTFPVSEQKWPFHNLVVGSHELFDIAN
jgi:hypothetical protein